MTPLSFTDDEMDSLASLAKALPRAARDGFLQMVAGKPSAYPPEARGPGGAAGLSERRCRRRRKISMIREPDMPADDQRLTLGQEIIAWIETTCRVPEGILVGQPIELMDWQKREVLRIYDNPATTRRAIISVGRKSGKTTFAACLLLVHLAGPAAIPNSQLYSAAQSRDQAALLYALAAKIVRMSSRLSAEIVCKDGVKQLVCPARGRSIAL